MISGLDHFTINTGDLAATERFWVDVMGMALCPRPDFPSPGLWIGALAEGPAIIHVVGVEGRELIDTAGAPPAVDHVALQTTGFDDFAARLDSNNIPWRGNIIREFGRWQMFFRDPNGVLIELTFDAALEPTDEPLMPMDQHVCPPNILGCWKQQTASSVGRFAVEKHNILLKS